MNSCNTDRFLATTVVCGLSTLISLYASLIEAVSGHLAYANSPTPTGELAYVGEFDQRHRRVRCL